MATLTCNKMVKPWSDGYSVTITEDHSEHTVEYSETPYSCHYSTVSVECAENSDAQCDGFIRIVAAEEEVGVVFICGAHFQRPEAVELHVSDWTADDFLHFEPVPDCFEGALVACALYCVDLGCVFAEGVVDLSFHEGIKGGYVGG